MRDEIAHILNNEADRAMRRAAKKSDTILLSSDIPLEIPTAYDIHSQNIAAANLHISSKSSFCVRAHSIQEGKVSARRVEILKRNHGKLDINTVDNIPNKLFIKKRYNSFSVLTPRTGSVVLQLT